jgi:hypothetical protein
VRVRRAAALLLGPLAGALTLFLLLAAGIGGLAAGQQDPVTEEGAFLAVALGVAAGFGSASVGLRTYRRVRGKRWNWLPPRRGLLDAFFAYVWGTSLGLILLIGVPLFLVSIVRPDDPALVWLMLITPMAMGTAPTVGVLATRRIQRRRGGTWRASRRARAFERHGPDSISEGDGVHLALA